MLPAGTGANKTRLLEHRAKVNRHNKLSGSPKQLQWRVKQIVKINMSSFVADLFWVCVFWFTPPPPHLLWDRVTALKKNLMAKLRMRRNQYTKRKGRKGCTNKEGSSGWAGSRVEGWESTLASHRKVWAAFLRGQHTASVSILLSPHSSRSIWFQLTHTGVQARPSTSPSADVMKKETVLTVY